MEAVVSPSKIEGGRVFDEKDWNEDANEIDSAYPYSKVVSEKMVREFGENNKEKRVVILCPSLVMGPLLNPSPSLCHQPLLAFLSGQYPFVPNIYHSLIHVKDVAL